ncbi:MAG TPA: Crp/Fnr family transcriptional regulator [Patescibacteria group bacterium]|nr:Crp/Fnr family transcriptional regulator [Patescibacteria group bacterium]
MEDIIAAIRPVSVKRTFKKGSILLYQGEAPRSVFLLLEGVVKVYSLNTAGEEQVVAFHIYGDIFPGAWVFNKASTTLYYYEALTDCDVLMLGKDQMREVLYQKPEYISAMLDYYVTNYTGLMMRVTALEQSRASEKIMFTLYYLMFRYGKEVRKGVYVLQLQLTQSIIASLVGLTRETTATELGKLRIQKIVNYNTQRYTVNKQALERALGEDNFANIKIT